MARIDKRFTDGFFIGKCRDGADDRDHAGAGTLVPISGFANAIAAPAIDTTAEGLVLGLGAKIFTIAGPVILYGTTASVVYGILYFFFGR